MPPGIGLSRAYILKECLLRRVRPWHPWNAVFGGMEDFLYPFSSFFFLPQYFFFFFEQRAKGEAEAWLTARLIS